jgi:hypothetical protein
LVPICYNNIIATKESNMLNPLITVISGGEAVRHPFSGGVRKKTITQKHRRLVWECMLGTVYARDPASTAEEKYFDYDYYAAHQHAKVALCTDLRIYKPRGGRSALYGIPPA